MKNYLLPLTLLGVMLASCDFRQNQSPSSQVTQVNSSNSSAVTSNEASTTSSYFSSKESSPNSNEYLVIFYDSDGETILKTETVLQGQSANPPEPAKHPGYIFKGWDASYDSVQSDLRIIAQYEEITFPAIQTFEVIADVESVFTMDYYIVKNPGIWGALIEVKIDNSVFEFVAHSLESSIFPSFGMCGYNQNTSTYKFNGRNDSATENITKDGLAFSLTFKTKQEAKPGKYNLSPVVVEIINANGNDVYFSIIEGGGNVR